MIINFYNIAAPNNKITKDVPSVPALSIEGTLKDNCSLLDPTIIINSAMVPNFNYAYIEAFGRYYYCAPPTAIRTDLWEVIMHVDVLKTYQDGILNAPCIISKSSNKWNLYLNDTGFKAYQDPYIFSYEFPTGFDRDNSQYILTIFGDKE